MALSEPRQKRSVAAKEHVLVSAVVQTCLCRSACLTEKRGSLLIGLCIGKRHHHQLLPVILADCSMLFTLYVTFVPLENLPFHAAQSPLLMTCPTAKMSGASRPRTMSACITRSVRLFRSATTASSPRKSRSIAQKSSLN
ncbi:hypothetical protein DR91_2067 [Neisseria lactamica ATCC 23970]|nr:hypothetical protein DR91_2067 [Neisseria lactamica ATCC 23970]